MISLGKILSAEMVGEEQKFQENLKVLLILYKIQKKYFYSFFQLPVKFNQSFQYLSVWPVFEDFKRRIFSNIFRSKTTLFDNERTTFR